MNRGILFCLSPFLGYNWTRMTSMGDHNQLFKDRYAGRWVAVTGGAGFIGGHLCEQLLEIGAKVSIIDDLSGSDGNTIDELMRRFGGGRVRFVYGSILEPAALDEAVADADYIFHLAAMGSVPRSLVEPERCLQVNTIGTMRVAQAARRSSVNRWVLAASSSAYGNDPVLPKSETQSLSPLSPYAASKLAGEFIVRTWSASFGLPGVCLRYFNVFGSRQLADNQYAAVVASFMDKIRKGKQPTIYGDGGQSRDFTHVSNAVHATLLAGACKGNFTGQSINVGTGRQTTVNELARAIALLFGREDIEPIHEEPRQGDVPHSVADISLAGELLGFTPITTLEKGLAETITWLTKDDSGYDHSPQTEPSA